MCWAAIGEEQVRTGGAGVRWRRLVSTTSLPSAVGGPNASVAVDWALEPGRGARHCFFWPAQPSQYSYGSPDPVMRYSLPWFDREMPATAADGRAAPIRICMPRASHRVEVAKPGGARARSTCCSDHRLSV